MGSHIRKVYVAAVLMLLGPAALCLGQAAGNGSGLSTMIAVDMIGDFRADRASESDDAFRPREVELGFYGPIDPTYDGVLTAAAHREGGAYLFELHEATIGSAKLIPMSSFRLGQFFLGIGRLNRFHRHDWPFISAPKVQEKFFGGEGILDQGAEYTVLLPTTAYLSLTTGVTAGWTYGHSHNEGKRPKVPTHYGRLATFFDVTDSLGVSLGGNVLGRKSSDEVTNQILGIDLVAKVRAGSFNRFLLQTEAWQRQTLQPGAQKAIDVGSYVYAQFGIDPNLALGTRLDYFSVTSLEDALGRKVTNYDAQVVPQIIYKNSEFASFKAAYNHEWSVQESKDDQVNRRYELQATFILGAHPAHDF